MKSKHFACIVGLLVILSGCGDRLDEWELKKAEVICENRGGINYVNVSKSFHEVVRCKDGHKQQITVR